MYWQGRTCYSISKSWGIGTYSGSFVIPCIQTMPSWQTFLESCSRSFCRHFAGGIKVTIIQNQLVFLQCCQAELERIMNAVTLCFTSIDSQYKRVQTTLDFRHVGLFDVVGLAVISPGSLPVPHCQPWLEAKPISANVLL